MTSREIRLASRPEGEPEPSNFELAETDVRAPQRGELVVRNRYMSVDPYMRGRMKDVKSYTPPWQIGQQLDGAAIGEVIASKVDGFAEGDLVVHGLGWREVAVVKAQYAQKVTPPAGVPESAFIGVLGMPGLTAYVGLLDIAELRDGDIVFVSGAAGAVGSLAGQIAKLKGHTVIGSAGSPEKVEWLNELGFDAAFDYHDGEVRTLLREAAPDGIDVYFDNVGGDHFAAAIHAMKQNGRAALCGAISSYNTDEPAPFQLMQAIGKRLKLQGFIISDHGDRRQAFIDEVGPWVADGRVQFRETIVDGGVEAAPQAFIDLLRGANTGKMLVRF
ncbi:NADP-dependent oxidoreductase [Solirubrobacter sp. CPCC 204708]|uniref:NADP-dependent oxidoreductase n=1 Tax=Solirubrobacter deserti TaxID=2282478 RepID=A0ABT4RS72_9ACTN|nr:NADP-dependent oxidoreductase [Solirubrobacter deserti]MBE2319881.1 NADP-dependent oxidoreductase [Solirubrobacter deserti]MDA0141414.1 NADP-dependent oxidoreductase [Solirubrobacter deserti]